MCGGPEAAQLPEGAACGTGQHGRVRRTAAGEGQPCCTAGTPYGLPRAGLAEVRREGGRETWGLVHCSRDGEGGKKELAMEGEDGGDKVISLPAKIRWEGTKPQSGGGVL